MIACLPAEEDRYGYVRGRQYNPSRLGLASIQDDALRYDLIGDVTLSDDRFIGVWGLFSRKDFSNKPRLRALQGNVIAVRRHADA